MILPDVNVLVYAHRTEFADHPAYAAWLKALVAGPEPFGCSELALSGFVRVVTLSRSWREATSIDMALEFCQRLLRSSRCVRLRPGEQHWAIFQQLCSAAKARGKLVADAYHAALAIEHGCELATADADFARFPGLRWFHPLRPASS